MVGAERNIVGSYKEVSSLQKKPYGEISIAVADNKLGIIFKPSDGSKHGFYGAGKIFSVIAGLSPKISYKITPENQQLGGVEITDDLVSDNSQSIRLSNEDVRKLAEEYLSHKKWGVRYSDAFKETEIPQGEMEVQ